MCSVMCGNLLEHCSGLSRNDFHRFMCLNTWPIQCEAVRSYGLVRVGVVLLEEVCHCRHRL